MKKINTLLKISLLTLSTLITAKDYTVDYAKYRDIPQDSTIYQLTELISQEKIDIADSLYYHKLEELSAQNNFSHYLFYANEYSYSRYTHNTRFTEAPLQLLDSALKVAKPHLAHDDFELFLGEYNMSFFVKDNPTRIKWIKTGLSHLDFDKYDFAVPIYSPMASLYYEINEYDSAWHYWDIVKEDTSLSRNHIANLYSTIAAKTATYDSEIAIDFIKQAISLRQENEDPTDDIKALGMLTALYAQQGHYDNSIKYGIEAIKKIEKNQNLHSIRSLTNHNYWIHVIESYTYLNDTKNARFWINDMTSKTTSFRNPGFVNIRKDWIYGIVLNAECQYDSAQYYYDRSNQGFLGYTKDSLSNYLTNGYYYKAESYLKSNDIHLAIDYYKKAIVSFNHKYYQSINDNIKTIEPENIQQSYLIYNIDIMLDLLNAYTIEYEQYKDTASLYEIMRVSNYCNRLIKYRFRGITTPESALETSANLKRCSSYGLFACKHLSQTKAHYLDSAFIMADLPRSFTLNYNKLLANSNTNDTLMQSIAQLSIDLSNAKQAKLSQEELFEIKYQLYRSKSILTRTQIKDFSFMDNSGSFDHVKSQLKPEDGVLQITCKGDSCYIICLTKEKSDIQLQYIKDLDKNIKTLTRAIKTNGQWPEASQAFYKAFILPFENQLTNKKNLMLYVDEKLQNIPFSLLSDTDNTPIIQRFAIKYNNSAKSYQSASTSPKNILIMAPGFVKNNDIAQNNMLRSISLNKEVFRNTESRTHLSPLPSSLNEAKAINRTCKKNEIHSQLTLGDEASKHYFIKHSMDFDILHIATHGIATDQYQTGLFFSPDPQTTQASFISTNELYKQNFKAQLVVLSACQSGLGEMASGEGIIGLPRSFIYAGTPNIIASLWKVHDSKTQTLMNAFYQHLLNEKVSYQKALQLAKLDCIQQGFLAMDWAGFILISE